MTGRLAVTPRTQPCPAGCAGLHSYLPDGRRVCWRPRSGDPARRHAVDAELVSAAPPERLYRRWLEGGPPRPGAAAFWAAWTRAEALAKLADVPIAVWLRRHGLDAPTPRGVRVGHRRLGDALVCLASAA